MPRYVTRFSILLPLTPFFTLLLTLSVPTRPANAQSPAGGANNTLSAAEKTAGWTLLFDGRSLSGWSPLGDVDWKVEDGTITATKGTGFIVTTKPYGNFELKTDFWIDKDANSGIFFRCPPGPPNNMRCYEANIYDGHETDPTGSLFAIKSSLPNKPDAVGKWNTFDILANGTHLVLKVNGQTTADVQDKKLASGPIALQRRVAGVVRFRNVKIRPL